MNYFQSELVYDDITLFSREISTIKSRFDQNIKLSSKVKFGKKNVDLGILMSSPMLDVSGEKMAEFLGKRGHTSVTHRFMDEAMQEETFKKILFQYINFPHRTISFSVGIHDCETKLESVKRVLNQHPKIENLNLLVCIDTANGASELLIPAIEKIFNFKKEIKKTFSDEIEVEIMAGNIVTSEAADFLYNLGVKFLRIGIGSGSVCSTPMVTGIFRPVVSSIMEIYEWRETNKISDCYLVADGGIRGAADVMKAIAVGADFVMMGSLFAGFDESNGELIREEEGKFYKLYRGMASYDMAKLNNTVNNLNKPIVPEGVTTKVPYRGSLEPWFEEFLGSLRSCMSYCNARTIEQFRVRVEIVVGTTNTNFLRQPHKLHN